MGRLARWLAVGAFVVAATGVAYFIGTRSLCACSAQEPPPPSPVVGVVIAVDSSGIGAVKGFTILTPEGRAIGFLLGTLENATEFSPSHLAEHQASSVPVRAFYRLENGVPVVYRLEDAPT